MSTLVPIRLTLSLLFAALCACSQPNEQHKHTVFAFGTLIDITLTGVSSQQAAQVFLELEQDFLQQHANWTPWQDSDLSRANRSIHNGESFRVPRSIEPLITQSKRHYINSEGLFNPAIGELIKLWRFHEFDQPGIKPPNDVLIRAAVAARPSITDIVIKDGIAHSTNPAVDLNFGAFAKGYAIKLAMKKLATHGIANAVINAGGDLTVAGKHGQRAWNIGIRHPRKPGMIASLQVTDGESVFTSGDYERFYFYKGKRYHHILNPRTGYPSSGIISATVVHHDAATADAAATALMIAGPQYWHRIASRMGIRYAMLIDDQGTVHMNPAMANRLQFEIEQLPRIVLSEAL